MEPVEILICLILIALSAFLAGSEIALFTLSKLQLRQLREKFHGSSRVIRQLLADPPGLLMTILIVNEALNVALSTLITSGLAEYRDAGLISEWRTAISGQVPPWAADAILGTIFTAPLVLLFGEITPKIVGARLNHLIAPVIAQPLNFVYQTFAPVRSLLQGLSGWFAKLFPKKRVNVKRLIANRLKEADFLSLVEEAHREGDVRQTELALIRSVFALDQTSVGQLCVPIAQVFKLSSHLTLGEARAALRSSQRKTRYSRIPVYDRETDHIVGVLYAKDLLVAELERADPETPVLSLVWKPLTAHHATRLGTVFNKMKRQRSHMAVILSDSGAATGVVTMNDILGTLLDEFLESEA